MLRSTFIKFINQLGLLPKSTSNQTKNFQERLIKNFASSFGLQGSYIIFSFLISVLLARLLDKVGYGIYSYAITWLSILAIPSTLGLNPLLVREIAIYQSQSAWSRLRGLLQWANMSVFIISTGMGIIAIALTLHLKQGNEPKIIVALCIAFASLPIISLTRLRLSAMKGLHQVVLGQLPDMLFHPILFILCIISSAGWLSSQENAAVWVVFLKVIIDLISLAIGINLLSKVLPEEVKRASPQYEARTWLKESFPFMLLNGLFIINSRLDILMLGSLQGAGAVGIYAVIIRLTTLIGFGLQVVDTVLSPTFAALYVEENISKLQKLVTYSTRLSTLFGLVATLFIISFSGWILLIFGQDFVQGKMALIILSMGYLVNAMTGAASRLLHMTRNTQFNTITSVLSVFLNICLNSILIPKWGISGAATATAVSMIISNVLNAIWSYKKLRINTFFH